MTIELTWNKDTRPQSYRLYGNQSAIIGRRRSCDIVLSDKTVSRQHAEIFTEQGQFHLVNLSQTNAVTLFAKRRLAPGENVILDVGYRVRLGFSEVVVRALEAKPRCLKVTADGALYRIYDEQPVTLGRDPNCDILLPGTSVSRRHAEISVFNGQFFLLNQSESTAIYVFTKQRLAKGGLATLKSGDIFRVGMTRIETTIPQRIDPLPEPTLDWYHLQCPGCQRKVETYLKDCPWCGVLLANGLTVI